MMRANRSDVRLALALFCVLTCLYWLTGGAHTYIADGETMYLGTEALVERGTFVQLAQEQAGDAPRKLVEGRGGALYPMTAPLQSLLAVPFYVVGSWVARAFPAPFSGYFSRFFVCLFNGPVCAATVALLYLFGVDLGYRRRTSLFVALAFGLATIAWPYARTFYAETLHTFWLVLAAWAVCRYARTEHLKWIAVTGLAMGLGTTAKYVMAVAGPAFALYLVLEFLRRPGWRARWRWAARTLLAGGLPFVLIICALLAFNYARFGSPLETGHVIKRGPMDTWSARATPLLSLYGFFFSSGKGFFFFSPPAVLSLWGLGVLSRRHKNETWLLVVIAVMYPLFYSLGTHRWHGGGNWGPRYIACITPFLTLPVGAFLERRDIAHWWRAGGASALFILGFCVQVSTVLVNYSTYLFSDVPADEQRFHPAHSTLAAQWRLWPQQLSRWRAYDHALRASGEQFYVIDGGFYDVEVPDLAPFGRWMGGSGRLRTYARPQQGITIQIAYSRPRPADAGTAGWPGLRLIYDGVPVTSERHQIVKVAENEEDTQWVETLTIPSADVHVLPGTLEITATTWIPSELGDPRELSVFVERVEVLSDGVELALNDAELPQPLPVSTAHPWSWEAMLWFYDPFHARPFDVWAWYVWTSGVPLPRARAFIAAFALVLGSGFVASIAWLFSLLRRSL